MEPAAVVDLVDEAWKVFGNVAEGLVGHWIDRFDLHRLHEALRFGVIVGIATPAHRADEAMAVEGLPIGLRGILRAADALLFVKRQFGWR